MKILIIHFKYYISGGPERYLFNLKEVLENNSNEVIIFSLDYSFNENSPYKEYFAKTLISKDEFSYKNIKLTLIQKIKIFKNFIYNKDVKLSLDKLIKDTKPDITYILSFKGKLSPSIFSVLEKYNLPVVHRISDFSLFCSNNVYFRKNKVCRKCDKNLLFGVIYSCQNNSFTQSLANYFSLLLFYYRNYHKVIDLVITPSFNTFNIFKENKRFKKIKILHIPTFIDNKELLVYTERDYLEKYNSPSFIYWGRIASDKGIKVIIDAIRILNLEGENYKIEIIGFTNDDYSLHIKEYIEKNNVKNIHCYPFMNKEDIFAKAKNATASIIPSLWYENMPNSLIESQSLGVPVIASNIGCFPELISDGYNGLLFEINNENDLARQMKLILKDKKMYFKMCNNSFKWSHEYCSKEAHYKLLISNFKKLSEENHKRN